MSKTTIRLETEGPCATITFVTEDGLNVGSSGMMRELGRLVAEVSRNRTVRTTVITGTGKVFLAGADIKEMSQFVPEQAREYGSLGQAGLNAREKLPSITNAASTGAAGSNCSTPFHVAACDPCRSASPPRGLRS